MGVCCQAPAPFGTLRPPLDGNRLRRNVIALADRAGAAHRLLDWTEGTVRESDGNVFWNAAGAVAFETQAGPAAPRVRRSPAEWQRLGYDRRSRVADPQFVAPGRDDYRLAPTSPALALGLVPTDPAAAGVRPEWKRGDGR